MSVSGMYHVKEGNYAVNQQSFWCNICKVACASAVNLQTHFLGSKHKLLEKALKAHGIVKSGSPEPAEEGTKTENSIPTAGASETASLEEQLSGCRSTEPAVGLEYLYEYRTNGNYVFYECTLCDCEAGLTNMFMHVVGAKHRLAYLTKHYPEMAEVPGRGSELHKRLKVLAGEVEARDGRKHITVVTDTQQLKRKYAGDDEPNKKGRIDFTSDDCFLDPPPPPPPPQAAAQQPPSQSFQDLKKAHEAAKKHSLEKGMEKAIDGFGTKKELLDYLRQFQIVCEDDAAFVLKVTQSFTQSLVQYRMKSKANAEPAGAAPPSQQQQQQPPPQQAAAPPATGQNIYTEYPPKNVPGQAAPPYHAEVNRGAAGSQAPPATPPVFLAPAKPKEAATAAPRTAAAPGGLPLPETNTNKATIEFFTSIKNMDAAEVSATLNKIAASNPAFRGIDIPNVIKILSDSGSLKTSG